MNVVVSGSSGLVGSALMPLLTEAGHEVLRLVRDQRAKGEIHWSPSDGQIDAERLEGADACVHLAGESIASGRWTAAKKQRMRDSRVLGTTLVSQTMASLRRKPQVLVCASAIGFYGDRGDEVCDEESPVGEGYLAELCRDWEAATEPARQAGIRVINLRIGIVLSTSGGALSQMLLPFRLGLGGVIGNGQQYWSWISLPDLLQVILFALKQETLVGPVNGVSPTPVTNHEFTKTLGQVIRRPTVLPLPTAAARLVMGEMADALILASARVQPTKLMNSGYRFLHSELGPAMRAILAH